MGEVSTSGKMLAGHGEETTALRKAAQYREVAAQIASLIADEPQPVARMASIVCLLSQAFAHFFWTGFYCVDPDDPETLVVGPYQGTPGCLRIAFGRGVCGVAAARCETQIVPDVHAFAGHIACDSRSNSEIVVPVVNRAGRLLGVLDIDSTAFAAFDETDALWLKRILDASFADCGRLL